MVSLLGVYCFMLNKAQISTSLSPSHYFVAFILYRQHYQNHITAEFPGISNPDVSKVIGDRWRNLDDETRAEWKQRAEEEKEKHQQLYPDYRYQPKRAARKSILDITKKARQGSICTKCGLPATAVDTPQTPTFSQTPHDQVSRRTSPGEAPSMNNLTLSSPGIRRNSQHPRDAAPPAPQIHFRESDEDHHHVAGSPDSKRQRFANAQRPMPPSPYPFSPSAYRDSHGTVQQVQRWSNTPSILMGPPPPARRLQGQVGYTYYDPSRTLPPLQSLNLATYSPRPSDPLLISVPSLGRIYTLGRISPPYQHATRSTMSSSRGIIIAVEGDSLAGIKEVTSKLANQLRAAEQHQVRHAQGPTMHENTTCTLEDYHAVISEWRGRSKQMIDFILNGPEVTAVQTSDEPKHAGSAVSTPRVPILLLCGYQLQACNSFAASIPITDMYSAADHWQWIATMWRGIVGADFTIYVKDVLKEELAVQKGIEIREEAKCIVVRREKPSDTTRVDEKVGDSTYVDETTMRRLAFEVGEWIRGFGSLKSPI